MKNKTYDILKFIACVVLPALATLILTIFKIWDIPYGEAIAGTITAIDTFLGAVLQISSGAYVKIQEKNKEIERLTKRYEADVMKDRFQ
jgi:hypothetical protein